MYGYGGTRRRHRRRGGDGFDPSTPQGRESSFMKGKRQQDESEAQRMGDLAHSRKKEVVEKLETHAKTHPLSNLAPSAPSSTSSSRKSSTAGRRRRHRKTHRRRR